MDLADLLPRYQNCQPRVVVAERIALHASQRAWACADPIHSWHRANAAPHMAITV